MMFVLVSVSSENNVKNLEKKSPSSSLPSTYIGEDMQQVCGVDSKKEVHPLCARHRAMLWDSVLYGAEKFLLLHSWHSWWKMIHK